MRERESNLYEIFFCREPKPVHCVSTMIRPLAKFGGCFCEVHICSDGTVDKSLETGGGRERGRERERERERGGGGEKQFRKTHVKRVNGLYFDITISLEFKFMGYTNQHEYTCIITACTCCTIICTVYNAATFTCMYSVHVPSMTCTCTLYMCLNSLLHAFQCTI